MNDIPNAERTRCEIWTRVMGYHRPVQAWNPGKQQEHADRRYFREPADSTESSQESEQMETGDA